MRLSAIDIKGFKSFASPVHLEFGPGITAVIGPNGSGKSNLSEAIRWVLGEQSMKQLRGKSRTDVIFSGADERSRAHKASVMLTFDNESGRFPVESSEVSVRRTLTSDGESEYAVNGEPVRLVDLQQMIAEAGIGAKSFTVISQGMVDRYLTATPEGRRELFDEATGIKALQIRLHKAQQKMNKTRQHAHEVQTIITELEPRLRVLKRQIERYEQRTHLQEEFSNVQQAWFSHRWHELAGHIQAASAAVQETADAIATARGMRQRIEAQMRTAPGVDAPIAALKEKLYRANEHYAAAKERYEQTQAQRTTLETLIKQAQQEREEAQAVLQAQRDRSMEDDILENTQVLLRDLRTVIEQMLRGVIPSEQILTQTLQRIDDIQQRAGATTSVEMARSVLAQFEAPLQQVARLQAIEEERNRQLAALPSVQAPSRKEIETLAAALAAQSAGSSETSNVSQHDAEAALAVEIAAERDNSTASAALEQTRRSLSELEREIARERGTAFLQSIQTTAPADEHAPHESTLRGLATRIASLGEPDPLVEKEYAEAARRYEHLQSQLQDIQQTEQNIFQLIEGLTTQMRTLFSKKFTIIQEAFSSYFEELFGGGTASISLTEEGVDIAATPPGKRNRPVTLLSGGEKALTSLALLLAIIEASAPPFIVLDEVDAALDEANSRRFAHILREKAINTQSIVITHNRETMATGNVLYGVTMQRDGISKVYSVNVSDIEIPEQTEHMRV